MDTITEDDNDSLRFTAFCLDSGFGYSLNIELAYLLSWSGPISLTDAARIIKKPKVRFYENILFENDCFLSEIRSKEGWGKGGTERIIILSQLAREYLEEIQKIGEIQIGMKRCTELKKRAAAIRRRVLKKERSQEKKLEQSVKILVKKYNDPNYSTFLKTRANMCGISREELDNKVKIEVKL